MNTQTTFMGLQIQSPIVIGSCGFTKETAKLKEIEQAGAGAIILKSIFEEQILNETSNNLRNQNYFASPEAYDYVSNYSKSNAVDKYINLIKDAKQIVNIPIIASINCISNDEWLNFASKIETAGADGIELNMFVLPSDVNLNAEDIERFYEDTIAIIRRAVNIPISIKLSYYFTSLARFVQKISLMGIANINIFNRFLKTDIDIDNIITKPANILTSQDEIYDTIRWTSILSNVVKCSLTAGGGVHKEEDCIKLLLAGANTVQIVSALYEQGLDFITKCNEKFLQWGEKNNFKSINDFRGKLAIKTNHPSDFLRVQFMKYFAEIK
ncbi:MAG: dihydroorotate dehydrogenase-like protein [Bacteroidales bacterium]|jgi:dihydroorotate dehydrogenase (fumarate)|nr:dihydroorotate dehydrogenase-like protein [Bacteroidales bacterium]